MALVEAARADLVDAGRIATLSVVAGEGPLTVDVVLAEPAVEAARNTATPSSASRSRSAGPGTAASPSNMTRSRVGPTTRNAKCSAARSGSGTRNLPCRPRSASTSASARSTRPGARWWYSRARSGKRPDSALISRREPDHLRPGDRVQVPPGQVAQAGPDVVGLAQCGHHSPGELLGDRRDAQDDLREEPFLVREGVVEGPLRHRRVGGDVVHAGVQVAAGQEQRGRGRDDGGPAADDPRVPFLVAAPAAPAAGTVLVPAGTGSIGLR